MTNDIESLKRRAVEQIDKYASDLVDVSHQIHAHPEQNFEEFFASEMLTRVGNASGVPIERGVYGCETGFAADVGEGATVCVMSEYDALPEIGHGCGHNIIAAAGLGAAIGLASVAREAGGRLRYLGTPAEEGGGGKIVMAQQGALDGVDVAMMVHSADADLTTIDAIALQQLLVEYSGKASHAAAAPHEGRNALDAAVLGYVAVGALRQHIMPTERIHGIFLRGGDKPNIVPHDAATQWYVRSDTMTSLQKLKPRVLAALESGAHACGCTMSHTWQASAYADMITNNALAALYIKNAHTLGRTVTAPSSHHRVVGSTDMGNVSHLVPSIHPMIASATAGTSIHTVDFQKQSVSTLADLAVIEGAKAMALTAIDFWTSTAIQNAVREEFELANPDKDVL